MANCKDCIHNEICKVENKAIRESDNHSCRYYDNRIRCKDCLYYIYGRCTYTEKIVDPEKAVLVPENGFCFRARNRSVETLAEDYDNITAIINTHKIWEDGSHMLWNIYILREGDGYDFSTYPIYVLTREDAIRVPALYEQHLISKNYKFLDKEIV